MDGRDSVMYDGLCLNALNVHQQASFDKLEAEGLEPQLTGFGNMGTAGIECKDGITRWIVYTGRVYQVTVESI